MKLVYAFLGLFVVYVVVVFIELVVKLFYGFALLETILFRNFVNALLALPTFKTLTVSCYSVTVYTSGLPFVFVLKYP